MGWGCRKKELEERRVQRVEAGGEVQLKWEKELELRRDTMGVREK